MAAKPARAATLGRTPQRVHDRRVRDRCRLTDRRTRGFRAMSPADPNAWRAAPHRHKRVAPKRHKKINDTRATMTTRACFVLAAVAAVCPDYETRPYCSGHGDCSLSGRCECWDGWVGGSCAERTCPAGRAWADIATATDTAHADAECSSRGLCDRATGRCICAEGFEGSACQRMGCLGVGDAGLPLGCSGHGECLSLRDLARFEYDRWSQRFTYETPWDASSIYGCLCTFPYTGPACLSRICPEGDDPLTSGQANEVQLLSCIGLSGKLVLRFAGLPSKEIALDASPRDVEAAIEGTGVAVGDVVVSFTNTETTSLCYPPESPESDINVALIEFRTVFGELPPLQFDEHASSFEGSVETRSVQTHGELAVLRATNGQYATAIQATKERAACAGRGLCEESEGECACFTSNFELFTSSDLYGGPGLHGDCGHPLTTVTMCPGAEDALCSGNGNCLGRCRDGDADGRCIEGEFSRDLFDDDATPFPSYHAPRKKWQAEKPFQCACKQGWTGGDCSLMLCPRAEAWFGYPSRDDKAHDALQECAGMGTCDRTTGMCICPLHLTGAACERVQCPGADISGGLPCNGVGRCLSMRELALRGDTTEGSADHHLPFPGLEYGFAYGSQNDNGLTWDADRLFGCVCDEGFGGFDCTEKVCPLGDDPGTCNQLNELQSFACKYTDDSGGRFALVFREQTTVWLPHNASALMVEKALEALTTVGTLSVTITHATGYTAAAGPLVACAHKDATPTIVHVQFETQHGDVPRMTSLTESVSIRVYADGEAGFGGDAASHAGTTEEEPCSNRGLCDRATGQCTCFLGYGMSDGLGNRGTLADCGYKLVVV